jgi:hypothetical protein
MKTYSNLRQNKLSGGPLWLSLDPVFYHSSVFRREIMAKIRDDVCHTQI